MLQTPTKFRKMVAHFSRCGYTISWWLGWTWADDMEFNQEYDDWRSQPWQKQ